MVILSNLEIKLKIKNFLIPFKNLIEKSFKIKIIRVRNQLVPDIPHSRIVSESTYSPWIKDVSFNEIYQVAKNYTLVDEYRMYEIYNLASQISSLDGDVLEVGTWRGGSSAIIQGALKKCNSNSKFFIADTFKGVVKAGSSKDTRYKGGEHSDASLENLRELYSKLKFPIPEILIGVFPDDHHELDIKKLSLVHSDVDAYDSTSGVIKWCLPRMVKGGIIIFDDYGFLGTEGVTRFVNELISDMLIKKEFLFIHNLNGHAILIKK